MDGDVCGLRERTGPCGGHAERRIGGVPGAIRTVLLGRE
jgi:hypothetical protein